MRGVCGRRGLFDHVHIALDGGLEDYFSEHVFPRSVRLLGGWAQDGARDCLLFFAIASECPSGWAVIIGWHGKVISVGFVGSLERATSGSGSDYIWNRHFKFEAAMASDVDIAGSSVGSSLYSRLAMIMRGSRDKLSAMNIPLLQFRQPVQLFTLQPQGDNVAVSPCMLRSSLR